MRVIIYDMRDAKEPGDRQIVLRLIDSTGCLRVQSPIYGTEDFAQNLGEVLAQAFGTELEWIGPSALEAIGPNPASAVEAFAWEEERTKAALSIGLKQLDLFG